MHPQVSLVLRSGDLRHMIHLSSISRPVLYLSYISSPGPPPLSIRPFLFISRLSCTLRPGDLPHLSYLPSVFYRALCLSYISHPGIPPFILYPSLTLLLLILRSSPILHLGNIWVMPDLFTLYVSHRVLCFLYIILAPPLFHLSISSTLSFQTYIPHLTTSTSYSEEPLN